MDLMISLLTVAAVMAAQAASAEESTLWTDPRCHPLETTKFGPMIQSDDGTLMIIDKNVLRSSADGGKTWSASDVVIDPGMNIVAHGHTGQFLRTRSGALVVVYLDFTGKAFAWDDAKNEPKPECRLELWTIRSTDGGKSWGEKQQLFPGYNADFMGFIQLKNGRLVATVEHLVPELARWICCSFVSDDDGKTWTASNWIDLGGRGHHDGTLEPAVMELQDGRLMMLIRTNLDRFWAAYSDDQGSHWRTLAPTAVEASSAPAWLTRLRSGRLMMAFNPMHPEGADWPKRKASSASEEPASWYRETLCITFSDNDGVSWSAPVAVARQAGKMFSYPYIFERSPGEIWLYTFYGEPHLALRMSEKDFAGAPQP